MSRTDADHDGHVRDGSPSVQRAPYLAPHLVNLGSAAVVTSAVMMMGLMDGFMSRRTG
jgi:hypothetical protein